MKTLKPITYNVTKREQRELKNLLKELNLPISERVKRALAFWAEGTEAAKLVDQGLESRKPEKYEPW